jgi:hypothetical protein
VNVLQHVAWIAGLCFIGWAVFRSVCPRKRRRTDTIAAEQYIADLRKMNARRTLTNPLGMEAAWLTRAR